MKQYRALHYCCVVIFTQLLFISCSLFPTLVSLYEFTHTASGQRILLFGDIHIDVPGGQRTLQQRTDLLNFLRSLAGKTLVIAEDKCSLLLSQTLAELQAPYHEEPLFSKTIEKITTPEEKNTQEYYEVSLASFLCLACDEMGIANSNCDYRDEPEGIDRYKQEIYI